MIRIGLCWLYRPVLACCRYKGVLRKGEIFPTTISKAALREAFLKRCSQQTRLSRGRQQVGVHCIKRLCHNQTTGMGMGCVIVAAEQNPMMQSRCKQGMPAAISWSPQPAE